MATAVERILEQIDALKPKDRQVLERKLSARSEAEWKRLAKEARAVAARRGINQAAIDRAV